MSSLEGRRLNHLEATIRAASGEQIVTIERLVAEVASTRVAEVALARRTEVSRAMTFPRLSGHGLRPTRPRRVVPCRLVFCSQ